MSDDHAFAPLSPVDGGPAPSPRRYDIDPSDPRTKLRENVIEAVRSIPFYFQSPITIEGLDAGDLFSLNTLLGVLTRIVVDVGETSVVELELSRFPRVHGGLSCPTLTPG